LLEILNYTQSFASTKAKLSRINVVINFPSLYPPGTAILIQLKQETTAAEIVQVILQQVFKVSVDRDFSESRLFLERTVE
jgi:hypothetical protein